jgi:hypothetical protein
VARDLHFEMPVVNPSSIQAGSSGIKVALAAPARLSTRALELQQAAKAFENKSKEDADTVTENAGICKLADLKTNNAFTGFKKRAHVGSKKMAVLQVRRRQTRRRSIITI